MDKLKLWQLREIKNIDSTTTLVENLYSKEIMLRKVLGRSVFPVMTKISELKHPNLMRIYDAMDDGKNCIILAEYVEGDTLDTIIKMNLPYAQKNAVKWTEQICSATAELHKAGVVHRDINPNNVMVDRTGSIRLVDFNISREIKENKNRDTTIMGTVGYTSPEQFGFEQTDGRADVYSIGVLLNVMLTGNNPQYILCDGRYRDIVIKATKINRDERYSTVLELSYALRGKSKERLPIIERFLHAVPGFRTGKLWKMLVASLFYILYFVELIWLIDTFNDYPKLRPDQIKLMIFTIALPFICFTDMFRISRIFGNINPNTKKALRILLGILIMVVSIFA